MPAGPEVSLAVWQAGRHPAGDGEGDLRVLLASFEPSAFHVALATELTYSRDESEKIFQRIRIGDCHADHDRLRPPI